MKRVLLSVFLALMFSCRQSPEVIQQGDIQFVPMESKRLPDLNESRCGHALVWASDHILAVGGHTSGFLPVSTAEYYQNGRWHTLNTTYTHDTPFALVLSDGDVLVGGGYESSFGVGQTWGVERYHPTNHRFTPSAIMDMKRAHSSAAELANGQIVLSGNWYAQDITEIYKDNKEYYEDEVWTDTASDNRSYPYILPMGTDNAWIIGTSYGSYGGRTLNIVDQIKGEPFIVDLLDDWHPMNLLDRNVQADYYRFGKDIYLIPALNAEGQCAPLLVNSSGFALLPMEQPLPKEGPWGTIRFMGSFWVVPDTQTAWLMGLDEQQHIFLAEIDCQLALHGGKAKHTIYYSQPLEALSTNPSEILLPDGSFVIVGGMIHNNFDISAAAYAFYPKGRPKESTLYIIIGVGLAFVVGMLLLHAARKRKQRKGDLPDTPEEESPAVEEPKNDDKSKPILADKLKALMEEKQRFRNKDLRLADVATELGTNTTYLSSTLSTELHTTFPAFVTSYRISYAQELMRNNSSMNLSQVAEKSGFSNERNFLRTFKAACGMTPSEWKQQQLTQ